MRKIIKWTAIVLGVLLLALVAIGLILHEPRPEGKPGPAAEALADKMLDAINAEAWDTTRYVKWNFAGMHQYVWDKTRKEVFVQWDDNKVVLNTEDQTGRAWQKGALLGEKPAKKLLDRAWSFFCNDSFWLNAPAKARDPGVERQLVKREDGSDALLVRYTSGGVTPGDSYLWLLDENGRPKAWKMWVKIIPVGGIESSWSAWTQLKTGAWVATEHRTAGIELQITDLAAGNTLGEIGLQADPFE